MRAPDEAVQVFSRPERLDEPRVFGEVRHDAHLDLRVVGGEEGLEPLAGEERRPHLAADGGLDGDVLQVRVVRRDAARGGAGLLVGGVHAAVGADGGLQRLDDLADLGGVAMLQQQLEERMRVLLLQVGEGLGVGGVPGLVRTGLRHAEFGEQHLLELLRGSEVHLAADLGVGPLRDLGRLGAEPRIELAQHLGRDGDALQLHARERRHQRHLDVAFHSQRAGVEARVELRGEPHEVPGLGGGIQRPRSRGPAGSDRARVGPRRGSSS